APEARSAQPVGVVSGGEPPAEGVSAGRPTVDQEAIQALAAQIQESMNDKSVSLSFSTYGKNNDKISVTVIDKETGEVIREIPQEELQQLSGKIEEMVGMVFDRRV
ncbi:MAG: flagellar protein FlaG, partial [Deltaproteobacteria bacterium]|nr:flagellar protein FlaG [Deltaproteobacteria bacterium]